jgi:hypothetical protein
LRSEIIVHEDSLQLPPPEEDHSSLHHKMQQPLPLNLPQYPKNLLVYIRLCYGLQNRVYGRTLDSWPTLVVANSQTGWVFKLKVV